MMQKRLLRSILLFGIFLVVLLGALLSMWSRDFSETHIVFLDVGQGDAILIASGSYQVLIDGGRSSRALLDQLGKYIPFWDRHIEVLVATHPDEDHIGGFPDLLRSYRVGAFVSTGVESETAAYRALQEGVSAAGVPRVPGSFGLSMRFPDGGVLETISPPEPLEHFQTKDTNATSIVMKLITESGKTFLFTGDLPSEREELILAGKVDVLKVGHHGSKHSTSDAFLEQLQPSDAVVSVGAKNRYGHPAPEALKRLRDRNIRVLRTDTQGAIEYRCPPDKGSECVVSFRKK